MATNNNLMLKYHHKRWSQVQHPKSQINGVHFSPLCVTSFKRKVVATPPLCFLKFCHTLKKMTTPAFFYISTSVACAKCELVTRLIFPFKIIFLGDLIELPMAKITQNSSSVGSLGLNLCLWISNSPSWNQILTNSVEFHPQLSNNGHPVDGVLVGAVSPCPCLQSSRHSSMNARNSPWPIGFQLS